MKSKELSECSDRVREEIGIQSSTIKTSSNMKPLNSKSTCTFTLTGEDIQKVFTITEIFSTLSGAGGGEGVLLLRAPSVQQVPKTKKILQRW